MNTIKMDSDPIFVIKDFVIRGLEVDIVTTPHFPGDIADPPTTIVEGVNFLPNVIKLRYGGRIEQSRPPRYLEGKVKCFGGMDSDEWGMMTLKEKVYEVGYKEEDNIRLFSLTDNGLKELLIDEDACALANYVIRPMLVEIWVVLGVVGNDEENNGEAEISADEGDGDSDWMMGDSANELSDSEFEVEETGVDDSDFFNFIDPNVEYGGDEGGEGNGMDEHAEINPKYINPETHFSGSEGEGSEGNLRGQSLNIGDEITVHAVKLCYGPPPKKMKTINYAKGKQVIESDDKAKGKKSLGLTKARTQLTRQYRTRSSLVMAKFKYGGNDKDPISID
nr:transposase, MuDR [Ipomoea batatas]